MPIGLKNKIWWVLWRGKFFKCYSN